MKAYNNNRINNNRKKKCTSGYEDQETKMNHNHN